MSRPTLHSPDVVLDAARTILFRAGVEKTTIQAISEESGAPVGSLYNRFGSRRDLLAQLWLRAAQRIRAAALPTLAHEDPVSAAVENAKAQVAFTRREFADARLLASFRREDLLGEVDSDELREALKRLNEPLERAVRDLTRRLFGDARARNQQRVYFAVIDMPQAAVRRHLIQGRSVPAGVEVWLECAVRAVLTAEDCDG